MRVVLDLETTSVVDLRRTGVHVYAEHPETKVTVLCYAIDAGPVQTWLPGQPSAAGFKAAVAQGAVVVAHNYLFEHVIYHKLLVPQGWPSVPLPQWSCTMARALVAGYPAGLELAGKAAGLAIQKDHSARDLMLRFARPRNWSPLTWWHETDPERYRRLCDYCAQDVAAERELDRAIPELSDRERALFEIDFHINMRGLGIDRALVHDLADLADRAHAHLTDRIANLTGGVVRTLNQVAQLRAWLRSEAGVDAPDLRRDTVKALLADPKVTGDARTVLQARLDASRSSTAKLNAIIEAGSNDGRVRGAFQFYGAARTGRWAGRRVQPQNLFRGSIRDIVGAIRLIRDKRGTSPEDLELLFEDSCLGVIASCVRSTITASPGHKLAIADFAQIEARVLAWLAGQKDVLDVFRRGDDIYRHTASAIGSNSRQLGKVTVLACIAEGEPVLTDCGLVPIEHLTKDMRVWDGVDWVSHDGVICRGEREIIEYDGLRATPDHLVWTEGFGDPVPLGDAASQMAGLVCSGAGRTPLRIVGGKRPDVRSQQRLLTDTLPLRRLRNREAGGLAEPEYGQDQGVPLSVSFEYEPLPRTVDAQGKPPYDCGPAAMPKLESAELERLWRTGDHLRFYDGARSNRLGDSEFRRAIRSEAGTRQDRQRQGVRSRQSALGYPQRAERQQTTLVYDILNAGPRHRFTVSGRLVHNCGYGMGGEKFRTTALGYGVVLGDIEAAGVVQTWRRANPRIVRFWWDAHATLKRVVLGGPGSMERVGPVVFICRRRALLAKLPSGRHLVYRFPKVGMIDGREEFSFMAALGTSWTRLRSWPGRTVENLTQAIARDVMADAMLSLRDVPVIATIHDELVAEVPEAEADATLDRMLNVMRWTPAWAPGLPVDAAGHVAGRYSKS